MTTEHAIAAIQADYARKMDSLTGDKKVLALGQVVTAGEMLAKHLRKAPVGTTMRDLLEKH